ncbi:MAG TPA: hypothetical protein VF109_09945, partial [Mycobacteriales bacterium]
GPDGRPDGRPAGGAPGGGAAGQDAVPISVVATVNLTRSTGSVAYVHPVPNTPPTLPDPTSPYALRVLAEDGTVLSETPVPVKPGSDEDPDEDRTGLIDAVIAAGPRAAAIELVHDGRTLDTFRSTRSAGAEPPRGVTSTVSGAEIVLDLGREAAPGTTYVVQVSDDGRRWRTVGVGLRSPRIGLDRREAARRGELRVRVTATDGFTSTVVAEETVRG